MSLLAALACASSLCAFVGARVEVGDGTTIPEATVLVDHGVIRAVGGAVPAGATVVDAHGKVLAPGFIETQSALGLVEIGEEPSANDGSMRGKKPETPAFRAADAFDPFSAYIPPSREQGVLHAVVAPQGGVISGQATYVALGSRLSDRPDPARPVAVIASVEAGAGQAAGGARGAAWLHLREALRDARDYQKNPAAYQGSHWRARELSLLDLEALGPVLRREIPLVLGVDRAGDILTALDLARDEKIRLVIAGGAEAYLVRERLAREKVPVLVTPEAQDPSSFDQLHASEAGPRLLDAAGVPLVISTASWDNNVRRLRQEAGRAVSMGLTHEHALRAITYAAAQTFGQKGGRIAPGEPADLVIWSGDPLELSSIAERVFLGGQEMSLETRQKKLAERYK